jgi:hypothetical protein
LRCGFLFVGTWIKVRVLVKGSWIKLVVLKLGQRQYFFYKPGVEWIIVRFGFLLAKSGG